MYTIKLTANSGSIKVGDDPDVASTHFVKLIYLLMKKVGVDVQFDPASEVDNVWMNQAGDICWHNVNTQQDESVALNAPLLSAMLNEGIGRAEDLFDITAHDNAMQLRIQSVVDAIRETGNVVNNAKLDILAAMPSSIADPTEAITNLSTEVSAVAADVSAVKETTSISARIIKSVHGLVQWLLMPKLTAKNYIQGLQGWMKVFHHRLDEETPRYSDSKNGFMNNRQAKYKEEFGRG